MCKIYNKTQNKTIKETMFLSEAAIDQATLRAQSDDVIQVIEAETGNVIFPG